MIYDNNIPSGMSIGEYLDRIVIPPGLNVRTIEIID